MEEIHQFDYHQINYNYQQNEDNTSCICDNSNDSDYFQSYYEKGNITNKKIVLVNHWMTKLKI